MSLYEKRLSATGQTLFIHYPGEERRTPYKRSSITILMDDVRKETVEAMLDRADLRALSLNRDVILSFPTPPSGGWNAALDPSLPDGIAAFLQCQEAMSRPEDTPVEVNALGIPTTDTMLSTWHAMNDVRYVIGLGSGADMALTLAACAPDHVAGVLALGGALEPAAMDKARHAPMPVMLCGGDKPTIDYFLHANGADVYQEPRHFAAHNPCQSLWTLPPAQQLTPQLAHYAWDACFGSIRRSNTGDHGDCVPRMKLEKAGLQYVIENDTLLPDGLKHTWFAHVPEQARQNPEKQVPMLIFFHGGSDNPAEAAEMTKLHELGEKESFITVYPWGGNRCGWNMHLDPSEPDDVAFTLHLIDYMAANYPVDTSRVYLSGFSNGAGFAMAVGLMHPERIAAIFPIDSNWPGVRIGAVEVDPMSVPAFRYAAAVKNARDLRLPVWYTYGTREPSYPVYQGCSQQHQYDFIKWYNNIEVMPTPPRDAPHPCGCGVPGQAQEQLSPSTRYPHHRYHVHRFFSRDEQPLNLYNYVMLHHKGHDVAEQDTHLGWQYVRQFRRAEGGMLMRI